jgi:predicted CopG family antitoxin
MVNTTITIREELWEFLNKEKHLGESLDEVITRLLKFKPKEK